MNFRHLLGCDTIDAMLQRKKGLNKQQQNFASLTPECMSCRSKKNHASQLSVKTTRDLIIKDLQS